MGWDGHGEDVQEILMSGKQQGSNRGGKRRQTVLQFSLPTSLGRQ